MAEDRTTKMLDRIEKLIVDGNRDVINRIVKVEDGAGMLEEGQKILEAGQRSLEAGQKKILEAIKTVHGNLKNEINVTAVAVREDLREEIKKVNNKIEEHMRQPAHV